MAAFMLNDVVVTVNGVDLSAFVRSCAFNPTHATLTTTAMGDTAETLIGGLSSGDVSIEFISSFAASETYATLDGLQNTVTVVTFKPTSDATAATNPLKTVSVLVTEVPFVDGAVGDLASVSVSWPMTGSVVTAIA
jgi:hypothetical protein